MAIPPRKEKRTNRVTVDLSDAEFAAVATAANDADRKVSDFVRYGLLRFMFGNVRRPANFGDSSFSDDSLHCEAD